MNPLSTTFDNLKTLFETDEVASILKPLALAGYIPKSGRKHNGEC